MTEALREENRKLREALRQSYIENLTSAYYFGSETKGVWTHMFMSDGEWLISEIGMDPAKGWYDAAEVKSAIPAAADRMVRALSEAEG